MIRRLVISSRFAPAVDAIADTGASLVDVEARPDGSLVVLVDMDLPATDTLRRLQATFGA